MNRLLTSLPPWVSRWPAAPYRRSPRPPTGARYRPRPSPCSTPACRRSSGSPRAPNTAARAQCARARTASAVAMKKRPTWARRWSAGRSSSRRRSRARPDRFRWPCRPRTTGPTSICASPGSNRPAARTKMDKDNQVKLAFMLEDNKVPGAQLSGCWETCHGDARTMPGAKDDKKTKYVKDGSLARGKFYDLLQWTSKGGKQRRLRRRQARDGRRQGAGRRQGREEGRPMDRRVHPQARRRRQGDIALAAARPTTSASPFTTTTAPDGSTMSRWATRWASTPRPTSTRPSSSCGSELTPGHARSCVRHLNSFTSACARRSATTVHGALPRRGSPSRGPVAVAVARRRHRRSTSRIRELRIRRRAADHGEGGRPP